MSPEIKKGLPEGAFPFYIDEVAGYLAEGLRPAVLRDQGRIAEAQMLGFWMGEIDTHRLKGVLEKRIEALRQQKETPKSTEVPLPTSDPEREINSLHIQQKRYDQGKLIMEDAAYEARQQRKARGFRKKWAEILGYRFQDAIEDLKASGAWKYLEGGTWNDETIRKAAAKMRAYRGRNWESSEGITIYPDEESYQADIYDSE